MSMATSRINSVRHKGTNQAAVGYHYHRSQIKAQLDLVTGADLQLQELQCKESSTEDTEDEKTASFQTSNHMALQS